MARVSARGVVAAILVLIVAVVCIRLGFWQLDRLEQRRARNEALRRALALPPLELRGETLAAVAREPERFLYRRVRIAGRYETEGDLVLRGRALQGRPGVHLVTPLRVAGGDTAVLVNRGWIPAADGVTVEPGRFAEPGARQVEGIVQPLPDDGAGGVPLVTRAGGRPLLSYQRLDLASLQARTGHVLLPVYVQELPSPGGTPSPPRRIALPELSEGPHLGYAVQWFSFAAIAVGGFLLVALRGRVTR